MRNGTIKKPVSWLKIIKHSNTIRWGAMAGFTLVFGFNCGRTGFQNLQNFEIHSALTSATSEKPELPVMMLTSEQQFKNMLSVTGIESATTSGDLDSTSADTISSARDPLDMEIAQSYETRKGSLPSVQDLSLMNGPQLVSTTNLSLSVCNKLYDRESNLAPESRNFFNEINLLATPDKISGAALDAASTRMSRSFWNRNIASDELAQIRQVMLSEYGSSPSDTPINQTRLFLVGLCSAMLSSFDALVY